MEPWKTGLIATGSIVGGLALFAPAIFWFEVLRLEKPKYEVLKALGKSKSLTGKPLAELRSYPPMLIAEVEMQKNTMKEASSDGFRAIAGFIFGKNSPVGAEEGAGSEKIAMTSPVRMEMSDKDSKDGEKIAMTSPVRMEMADKDAKDGEKIAMTSPVRMDMVGDSSSNGGDGDGDGGVMRMSFVMPSKYTKDNLPKPKNERVQIKEVPGHTAAALKFSGWIRNKSIVEKKQQQLLDILKAEGLEPEGDVMLYQYHPPFMYGFLRHNEVLYRIKEESNKQQDKTAAAATS